MLKRIMQTMGLLIVICALASGLVLAEAEEISWRDPDHPMLETVNIVNEKDQIQILMTFDQVIEYTDFALQNPTRFVIDVQGGSYRNWFQQLPQNDPMLKQIRVFHNRDGLRIVAELKYDGPWYELFWDQDQRVLQMIIHRRFAERNTTRLAKGVEYHNIKQGFADGPLRIQAIEVDVDPFGEGRKILQEIGSPNAELNIHLEAAYRDGSLRGYSTVSDLVKQEDGLVGINGGYFGPNGYPLGLLIRDGQLVSEPIYGRTAFGIDDNGKMRMDRVSLKAEAWINWDKYVMTSYNRPRMSDELILYSPAFGKSTGTNQWGAEVVVVDNRVVAVNKGNSYIPSNGWVISAHGKYLSLLADVKVGDPLLLNLELTPDWLAEGVTQAIGGGPRLVADGFIAISAEEEKFQPDIAFGRAPRTAIGITPDNHLLMVVVDGRSKDSMGMTLEELANLMLSLGATQAMNLDGGGSSTLVIRNLVYNSPSGGKERLVHNGLILKVDSLY